MRINDYFAIKKVFQAEIYNNNYYNIHKNVYW